MIEPNCHVARRDSQSHSAATAAAEAGLPAQWSCAAIDQPEMLRCRPETRREGVVQGTIVPEHGGAVTEGQGGAGAVCGAQRGAEGAEQSALVGAVWYGDGIRIRNGVHVADSMQS